jgi:acyl carrier protein
MTVTQDTAQQIRDYVIDRFLFGQGGDRLSDDASFLEQNLVDSTGVLEMVMFLEQRFGFKVQDHELIPENLDSVNRIAAFVARKLA